MTMEEVKELHTGDEVFWIDPCELEGMEHTSHVLIIETIEIVGDIVCISEQDGGYLECFPWELS